MSPARARLIKANELCSLETQRIAPPAALARRVPREAVEAAEQAREIIRAAREQATRILSQAEREAAQTRLSAEAQGRADAVAALAAQAIALRARELSAAERGLEQQVALARLLAERVLGAELELDRERIVDLARQALSEARGARQIVVEAHPEDAATLEAALEKLGSNLGPVRVHSVAACERGNLKIVTDVGTLDASLGPQLERLSEKLLQSLKNG
jgi:flagellar assembly protein FliH